MTRDEYDTVCDWLRVKWLPAQDPDGDDIVRLDDFHALSPAEQAGAIRAMSTDDAEFWISVETARHLYVGSVDRKSGITEAKVARYPERYGRGFESDETL
ncbi:hypothetical protein ELI16_14525 [Rhizobium ruizarguesonis]|uniref:hypothetical protein n=1 Tax=Rhizobium ruizarguesonis TaxID=2081791 RepID=UPI00103015C3|nr:hypothetical protein [Rhizobium ruizarguesonis]TAW73067.1 hypothetical protein ELI16_14525 [Rhizobium ruizarguesonis]